MDFLNKCLRGTIQIVDGLTKNMMRSVCAKLLVLPPKNYSVSGNGATNLLTDFSIHQILPSDDTITKGLLSNPQQQRQKLIDQIMMKICVCPFCKMDSLKIVFGLNHYKCTGRISNKSGFLSPDIIPTRIDDKSKD